MRRLLLDTHVFLWWLGDDPRLGATTKAVIADGANAVYVSAASGWEIAIKRALGKLETPAGLEKTVTSEGFEHLPISFAHGERAGTLPPHHRDPFDRVLIAQAQTEGLELVSADRQIGLYAIQCLAADD